MVARRRSYLTSLTQHFADHQAPTHQSLVRGCTTVYTDHELSQCILNMQFTLYVQCWVYPAKSKHIKLGSMEPLLLSLITYWVG